MTRTGRRVLVIAGVTLVMSLATRLAFREFDFGTSLPGGFPNDVPIVVATITSCTTARSDDLVRVVEVRIQSRLPFQDVVQFYRNAFATGASERWNVPEFPPPALTPRRRPAMPSSARTRSS
jgi:hypothetical protein